MWHPIIQNTSTLSISSYLLKTWPISTTNWKKNSHKWHFQLCRPFEKLFLSQQNNNSRLFSLFFEVHYFTFFISFKLESLLCKIHPLWINKFIPAENNNKTNFSLCWCWSNLWTIITIQFCNISKFCMFGYMLKHTKWMYWQHKNKKTKNIMYAQLKHSILTFYFTVTA